VLVAIGFALVYAGTIAERMPGARRLLERIQGQPAAGAALRLLPAASAMAVVGAGLTITFRALAQQGVL
jgi:hypothetical protein